MVDLLLKYAGYNATGGAGGSYETVASLFISLELTDEGVFT